MLHAVWTSISLRRLGSLAVCTLCSLLAVHDVFLVRGLVFWYSCVRRQYSLRIREGLYQTGNQMFLYQPPSWFVHTVFY